MPITRGSYTTCCPGCVSPMPVERTAISRSQLCELLAVDPARFIAIEPDRGGRGAEQRDRTKWWIVVESDDMAQTTPIFPQTADNTKRKPAKKGKRGC